MKNKKDTQQGVFCGRRGIRRLVQGEQEGVYSLLQLAAAEAAPATPGRGGECEGNKRGTQIGASCGRRGIRTPGTVTRTSV